MDQHEHQSLKTMNQFMKSKLVKKLAQFLLSVSVFSFLLSNSRLSFLFSLNFYSSSIPLQFFSLIIDKNCIFLLWNGLLVFVAKYSGLISSSSKYEHTIIESFENYEDDGHGQPLLLDSKEPFLEKQLLAESIDSRENATVVQEIENEFINGLVEEKDTRKLTAQDEGEGEGEGEGGVEVEGERGFLIIGKEGKESEFLVGEDNQEEEELDEEFSMQEQEEDEEIGALSTEELNKKFEEFIRKTKEELRIEAQQQVIMVN